MEGFRPNIDENGRADWGAFATVDFESMRPYEKDEYKAWYKADILREQLRDKLILFSIVAERLPKEAMHLVLSYLDRGVIEIDDIASEDMFHAARLHRQARRLQEEIRVLGGRGLSPKEIAEVMQ